MEKLEPLFLKGSDLTIAEFNQVVRGERQVGIDSIAFSRLEQGRQLVFDLADQGVPIYGFTTGVGWNKDQQIDSGFFAEYNRNLIYCHTAGCGEFMEIEEARAALLARLATITTGMTGVQPAVAHMYCQLLNCGITPLIPWNGSIGQGDIVTLSHVGLTLMGEGEVFYRGKRVSACQALKAENLAPVTLGPKDGLVIVSSNGQSVGVAALLLEKIRNLINRANCLYALSLEGVDGNITPLDERVNRAKGLKGQIECSAEILENLAGSYLIGKGITDKVQDPLSFRDVGAVNGAVRDAVDYVTSMVEEHLNSTEDNPCLLLQDRTIISCSNFEITHLALGFEMVAQALVHVSRMSVYRSIKLANPAFTGLARFLSPDDGNTQAFQTIQKTFVALDAQICHLALPTTTECYALAGDIEDHANNAVQIVQRLKQMIDKLYYILGIEAMHAAQAVDLRKNITLGRGSQKLYDAIRKEIPFLDKDRPLSGDIEKAYQVMKEGNFIH